MSINRTSRYNDVQSVTTQFLSSDGSKSSVSASNPRSWVDSISYSDNHPNWKALIAAGQNCSTEMFGVSNRARSVFGRATVRYDAPAYSYWQDYRAVGELSSMRLSPSTFNMPSASLIEEARTQAEISFSKNFRNRTRQWQSGVFAGELLQTARMLASPAKALRKGVSELYDHLFKATKKAVSGRGRSRGFPARAVKDAIAGTYLEWQFGVKPLISDCDDAARAFRSMASGRTFDMIRIRGDGVAEQAGNALGIFAAGPAFPSENSWRQEVVTLYRVEVSLIAGWRSDRPGGQLPVPMMLGTTLGDVLPTAWELVPWSFLIDYFSNIGDVLDAWGMRFIDFAWINEVTRRITEVTIIPPPNLILFDGPFTKSHSAFSDPTKGFRKIVTRLPYDNSWTPRIQGQIPGMANSGKWLNMASLLAMTKVPSHLVR